MKDGFDVHDYKRRMELAVIKLKENKRVDPANRIKIFRFLDYAEMQGLSLPRRIRYLQNLTDSSTCERLTLSQPHRPFSAEIRGKRPKRNSRQTDMHRQRLD